MITAVAVLLRLGNQGSVSARSNISLNAPATTTVGNTNGMVTNALNNSARRPSLRAIKAAHGIAITRVTTVESAACQNVNQIALFARVELSTSLIDDQPPVNELATILMTG